MVEGGWDGANRVANAADRQSASVHVDARAKGVPLVWAIGDDVRLTRTDTRAVAPRLDRRPRPARRRRRGGVLDACARRLPVVGLALPGPGRPFDPDRDVARLRAEGVRYVFVTGAVADRVLAARDRYPQEARFYDDLRTQGKPRLPCSGRARADRALGLPLPPMRRTRFCFLLAAASAACATGSARPARAQARRDARSVPDGVRRRPGRSSRTGSTRPSTAPAGCPTR